MSTDVDQPGLRELDSRSGDGFEVTLLWSRSSGLVWVDVVHLSTGEGLRIEAEPARALEVYYNPFAFCTGAPPPHAVVT